MPPLLSQGVALMLWAGVAILVVGIVWAAFKGWMVWDVAYDLFNGGGAPTLDFPLVCPIPIAVGGSLTLLALDWLPFPGFGLTLYAGLSACFAVLLWWFDRVGRPERHRQLSAIRRRSAAEQSHSDLGEPESTG